jgi:CRISPR-associated protein Cmr4
MKNIVYTIKNLTNMHVGSGDANYGIIDKLVQRDPVTNHPTIHSSSMKGALRESAPQLGLDNGKIETIFGNEKDGKGKSVQGNYYFFDARLLSLPIRSSSGLFYRATTVALIDAFVEHLEQINMTTLASKYTLGNINVTEGLPKIKAVTGSNTVTLEDWTAIQDLDGVDKLEELIGGRIAILHDNDFKQISDNLPVIARNHLINGISDNLWYEEVVPREAVFYNIVTCLEKDVESDFVLDGKLIQIGGNATIGYGFCKFAKIGENEKK